MAISSDHIPNREKDFKGMKEVFRVSSLDHGMEHDMKSGRRLRRVMKNHLIRT